MSGPACVPGPSPGLPALSSPENWLQCPSLPPWGFMFPIICRFGSLCGSQVPQLMASKAKLSTGPWSVLGLWNSS